MSGVAHAEMTLIIADMDLLPGSVDVKRCKLSVRSLTKLFREVCH